MINLSNFGNVPDDLIQNANFTIGILNEIFAAFPGKFRFTSGYRNAAQNRAANGVSNSFHLQALAGDFVPVNGVFSNSDFQKISKIVSRYGFEVLKHNSGSGWHYHIEPKDLHLGVAGVVNVSANENSFNPLPLVIGAVLLLLILRD